MIYTVVINHQGDSARLACATLEEARLVRSSFIHWGGLGMDIHIEQE